jgi:hypothetical protein
MQPLRYATVVLGEKEDESTPLDDRTKEHIRNYANKKASNSADKYDGDDMLMILIAL